MFLTGSFNSRTITDGEVEATKRQKEIVGKSVSTNFFYLCEKLIHQFAHIIELMQQREKSRFRLKFGPSANCEEAAFNEEWWRRLQLNGKLSL